VPPYTSAALPSTMPVVRISENGVQLDLVGSGGQGTHTNRTFNIGRPLNALNNTSLLN